MQPPLENGKRLGNSFAIFNCNYNTTIIIGEKVSSRAVLILSFRSNLIDFDLVPSPCPRLGGLNFFLV